MTYKACEKRLALLALCVLMATALAARATPLLSGPTDPDAYYHERMVRTVMDGHALPQQDALSYGGRAYTYYPLAHAIPAGLALLLGTDAQGGIMLVNAIFIVASLALLHLLAKRWLGERTAFWALAVAAIMPAFVMRQTLLARPEAFAFVLLPAALLLGGAGRNPLVFLLFAFASLYHLPSALICLALYVIVLLLQRIIAWDAILGAIAGAAIYGRAIEVIASAMGQSFRLSTESMPLDAVGLVVFTGVFLVFAGIGWPTVKQNAARTWLLLATLAFLFASRDIIFLAVPLAIFAGAGIDEAMRKAGKHAPIVLALFTFFALFSFALYAGLVAPAFLPQDAAAARWLEGKGVALSSWDRGHFLTYYGVPVVADGFFEAAPELEKRVAISELVVNGNDAKQRAQLMKQVNASYVFADSRMAFNATGFDTLFDSGARVLRIT